MKNLKMKSKDIIKENIAYIAQKFPQLITESKDENGNIKRTIDFDLFKQMFSDEITEGNDERYRLDWPGKKASLLKANTPITKTLRPCREESVNFDSTENLYIEGDNFEVLKILQESYLGKIKMIYIDPPYNTGNDFIYKDNFAKSKDEYEEELGTTDEEGGKLFRNTDSNGRYHSDWLSMMYERLVVARDLLKDDGVIFISIDDNEVHNLRKICDEVFGEENFVAKLIWKSKSGGANDSKYFAIDHEYLLVYSKTIENIVIKTDKEATVTTQYNNKDENGCYSLDRLDKQSIRYSKSLDYEITGPNGESYFPKHKDTEHPNATWRWGKNTVAEKYKELVFKDGNVYTKNYKKEGAIARSLLLEDRFGRTRTGKTDCFELFGRDYFSNPKPFKLIRFLLNILVNPNDIILDFFSGSATTAHAVVQLNAEDGGKRKFIMVQLPEPCDENSEAFKAGYKTIAEIGKERIRRAGKKIVDELNVKNQQLKLGEEPVDASKLDIGFRVYKTDTTNMKDVFYHPSELKQEQLELLESNIKDDRTAEDLLTQVILDLGLELTLPIETQQILGNTVFIVQTNALVACFDKDIDFKIVDTISDLKPLKVVFKDASFKDDKDRINVEERFKRLSPETKVTVI